MSPFHSVVIRLEAGARAAGVSRKRLSMSKLRDAIAVALVDRTYPAARAAKTLPALSAPPPYIEAALARVPAADRRAFRDTLAKWIPEPDDGVLLALDNLEGGAVAPLYRLREGDSPFAAAVELDTDGTVTAGWVDEDPFAWDEDIAFERWQIHPQVNGAALAFFLRGEGRALLARIHAAPDDAEAHAALRVGLDSLDLDKVLSVGEWLGDAPMESLWDAAETLDEAVEELQSSAADAGIRLTGDLRATLRDRRADEPPCWHGAAP